MPQTIGPYTLESTEERLSLHLTRSGKYWFDLIKSLVLGMGSMLAVLFSTNMVLTYEKWGFLMGSLIFGFVAYLQLGAAIARWREPTQDLLHWDKAQDLLTLRKTKSKTQSFLVADLKDVGYQLNKETVKLGGQSIKTHYWGALSIQAKGQERTIFHILNTSRIVDPGKGQIMAEVSQLTQSLAKAIAKELDIRCTQIRTV